MSIVMPRIWWKVADVPMPSTDDVVPNRPATVVTTPPEVVTLRIIVFIVSATYSAEPSGDKTMSPGWLNRAFVPVPSVFPVDVPPASVVVVHTMFCGCVVLLDVVMARIFGAVLTYKVPVAAFHATPHGDASVVVQPPALEQAPSVEPYVPVPAILYTVSTVPLAIMRTE